MNVTAGLPGNKYFFNYYLVGTSACCLRAVYHHYYVIIAIQRHTESEERKLKTDPGAITSKSIHSLMANLIKC